jgi:PAS domain S-box-containing protein
MALETKKHLLERIRDLQSRLDEADETLRALRSGEVDAIMVSGPEGDQVYTLKGADEAYRVMVQNMAEGALTLSPDGLILFSNEQFASMLGIPLERVIGSSIRDFIAAEDAFVLSALLAGPARAEAQLRMTKGSAALVTVHISASKLWFDGVECVCLIVTDLTEQKRNQEIVAAERLARSILDQAAGAILVVDPDGKIIRASRAARQLAKRDVLLRQFDDVFCLRIKSDAIADSLAMDYTFGEILSTIQRHGSVPDLEATARLPAGQTLDVIVSAGILTGANSECLGCIVMISDVSGLKRAEQALRLSESRLRALGDNLPEGVIFRFCQDNDGKYYFDFISAGIERITGVSVAEIMSDAAVLFQTLPPEDLKRVMAATALSREQLTRFDVEVRHIHRVTGEVRWSLLRSSPCRNPDGSTVWEGIEFDITERKRAEQNQKSGD